MDPAGLEVLARRFSSSLFSLLLLIGDEQASHNYISVMPEFGTPSEALTATNTGYYKQSYDSMKRFATEDQLRVSRIVAAMCHVCDSGHI
jgi:hypothetical protein